MEQPNTSDELKEAPILLSARGRDPFIVPDGYFDHLPHRVRSRLGATESRSRWSSAWRPAIAVASLGANLALLIVRENTPYRGDHTAPLAIEGTGALAVDELLDLVDPDDLYAELATHEATWPKPGNGFTPEELAAYLDHAELPLDLLTEMP